MSGSENCFESHLQPVSRHEKRSSASSNRCVSGSSRTPSLRISPTHSRSSLRTLGLLTLAAVMLAVSASAEPLLTLVPTKDQKIVRRWNLPGGPRGLALANGLIYVGLADRQAVAAVDPKSGSVVRE